MCYDKLGETHWLITREIPRCSVTLLHLIALPPLDAARRLDILTGFPPPIVVGFRTHGFQFHFAAHHNNGQECDLCSSHLYLLAWNALWRAPVLKVVSSSFSRHNRREMFMQTISLSGVFTFQSELSDMSARINDGFISIEMCTRTANADECFSSI